MRKILGVFEVFLGVFEKTKEKKDREALLAKALLPPSRIYPESRNSGKEKAHKLKKILRTPAECPGDTRRDKQGSTGRCPRNFSKLSAGTLSGGMDWWRMEWPFSRVRKIFFRGRIFQENPWKIPQKERFLPNFRLRNLKIQSPKNCNSIPPAIPYPH